MTRQELNKEYFDWMCDLIRDAKHMKRYSYKKLLNYLHKIEFNYILDRDSNRAADGEDLRYRFAYDNDFDGPVVTIYLDDRPCSVLEMLVALSLRVEEHIMGDPEVGNQVGKWFWGMIDNLGLNDMYDSRYDEDYISNVINRFMNRDYEPDGEGGLVTIPNCRQDLRDVEIWYQMMWYLTDVIKDRGEER